MINSLELEIANVPYTFENTRVNPVTFSTLDHFLISPNLVNVVLNYDTIFSHNDFSDHFPIMLTLNVDNEHLSSSKKVYKACVAWHRCNDTNLHSYTQEIDKKLSQINPQYESLKCRNYKCEIHKDYIQELHDSIINICCESSINAYHVHLLIKVEKYFWLE